MTLVGPCHQHRRAPCAGELDSRPSLGKRTGGIPAKVDSPLMMRSWAPMRVKMRSTGASRADAAGTLQPSCADALGSERHPAVSRSGEVHRGLSEGEEC